MTFVSSDDINFIAFDNATQLRGGLSFNDPFAQLRGHLMHVVFVQRKFLGNLLVRQIKSHQIQTEYPFTQRLMMPGKDRVAQIVKV